MKVGTILRLTDAPELAPGTPDPWQRIRVVGEYGGEPVVSPVDAFPKLPEGVKADTSPKTVSLTNLQQIGYVVEADGVEATPWADEVPS